MPAFDPDDQLSHPADWRLIQNGWVVLFRSPAVLGETVDDLVGLGYEVVRLDAGRWPDRLHPDLVAALDFPDHYGENLAALNDCLSDVASGDYGWSTASTGLVVVIDRYDAFVRRDREHAEAVLDVWARQARHGALFGHRMIALVRSDDPELRLPRLGGLAPTWNGAEFLRSRRVPPT